MSSLRNIKRYQQAVRQNNGILDTDQLQIETRAAVPTDANLVVGRQVYVTGIGMRIYGEGGWFTIPTSTSGGSAGSWDEMYSSDKTLTINSTTLTFAGTHATGNVFTLTNASGSGECLQITNSGTGDDIQGTSDTWAITKAGAAVFTAITMGDDEPITLGASSDAVIMWKSAGTIDIEGATNFDGDMTIEAAHTITIAGNAATTVFEVTDGDVLIDDGALAITDTDQAAALVITANSATSNDAVTISATGTTTGSALQITTADATLAGGYYIECYDGAAIDFSVGEHGAVIIEGSAADTDALTLSLGDIEVTDSDNNQISSVNGVKTLLVLDNEGGVIGTGCSVLQLDAGGDVHGGSYILDAVFSGTTPAAGATAVHVNIKKADVVGISVDGSGTATREALKVDADTTGNYHVVTFHSDSVLASGYAVLNVDTGGALASGANLLRLDLGAGIPNAAAIPVLIDAASFTGSTKPTIMKIDAGGKDGQALEIDADPTTKDVVSIHTDAVIHSGKAALALDTAAAIASGANVFRITTAGTPDTGSIAFEMDIQDDCQAFKLDTDATTADAFYITHSGNLDAGKAVVHITDAGDPQGDDRYVLKVAKTTATANESVMIYASGTGMDATGLLVDCDPVYSAANLSAQATFYSNAAGDLPILMQFYHEDAAPAAGEYCAKVNFFGSDDVPGKELYASIEVEMEDVATGDPDGILWIKGDLAGTNTVSAGFTGNAVYLGAAASTLTTYGSWDLTISTNKTGANEPRIVMTDGTTGDITVTAGGGTGEVVLGSPMQREASVGITANVGSAQGNGAFTEDVLEISTCANVGDAVTLPGAEAGKVIIVINRGAAAADVFPASGDNINEGGANAAVAIAADASRMFVGIDATHWESFIYART